LNGIRISSEFAGGNIKVISEEVGRITLEQELRDSEGWWFYWQFSAESERKQTLIFTMAGGDVVSPIGPAISADGIQWNWMPLENALSNSTFQYDFSAGEKVYFSFSIPYQLHHFEAFFTRIGTYSDVERRILTVSEGLRAVPLLRIGEPNAELQLMMTCRHHGCESTANYVLEGLIERVLTKPDGWLRKKCLIHYIPFIDIDGVENGDQGKNRLPHDHNRDYIENSIYHSTRALTKYTEEHKPIVAMDFHCPYKWGGANDHPFFVKHDEPVKTEIEKLAVKLRAATAKRTETSAIQYSGLYDIEMGVDWNQPHGRSCAWMFERSGAKLYFSYEIPYFGSDRPYTAASLRNFGMDFADSLEQYLMD
jgi:hypothetical protein